MPTTSENVISPPLSLPAPLTPFFSESLFSSSPNTIAKHFSQIALTSSSLPHQLLTLLTHYPYFPYATSLPSSPSPPTSLPSSSILTLIRLCSSAVSVAKIMQRKHGIKKGDRVGLVFFPGTDVLIAFWGCLLLGAVPICLPAPLRLAADLPTFSAILEKIGASLVLSHRTYYSVSSKLTVKHRLEGLFSWSKNSGWPSISWLYIDDSLPPSPLPLSSLLDEMKTFCSKIHGGDDIAYLQLTSGSTGCPKAVIITHNSSLRSGLVPLASPLSPKAYHSYDKPNYTVDDCPWKERGDRGEGKEWEWGGEKDHSCVLWVPHYHDFFFCLHGGALASGLTMVIMSPVEFMANPLRWIEACFNLRAHVTGAPNFAYEYVIAKTTETQRQNLINKIQPPSSSSPSSPPPSSQLWGTLLLNGGEPLQLTTVNRFCEGFGEKILPDFFMNSYGMAEAVAAVCAAPVTSSNTIYIPKNMHPNQPVTFLSQDDPLGRSCCSVGGFSTNISDDFAASRFLVVDYETLEVVPEGVVGELWFTSEWLGQGYFGWEPEQNNAQFRASPIWKSALGDEEERKYLRTGDRGFMWKGKIYVVGRYKSTLILQGRNYEPTDIESCISKAHSLLRPGSCLALSLKEKENEEKKKSGTEELVLLMEVRDKFLKEKVFEEIAQAVREALNFGFLLTCPRIYFYEKGKGVKKTTSGKPKRNEIQAAFEAGTMKHLYLSEIEASLSAPLDSSSFPDTTPNSTSSPPLSPPSSLPSPDPSVKINRTDDDYREYFIWTKGAIMEMKDPLLKEEQFEEDLTFAAAGMSSIDRAQFGEQFSQKFGEGNKNVAMLAFSANSIHEFLETYTIISRGESLGKSSPPPTSPTSPTTPTTPTSPQQKRDIEDVYILGTSIILPKTTTVSDFWKAIGGGERKKSGEKEEEKERSWERQFEVVDGYGYEKGKKGGEGEPMLEELILPEINTAYNLRKNENKKKKVVVGLLSPLSLRPFLPPSCNPLHNPLYACAMAGITSALQQANLPPSSLPPSTSLHLIFPHDLVNHGSFSSSLSLSLSSSLLEGLGVRGGGKGGGGDGEGVVSGDCCSSFEGLENGMKAIQTKTSTLAIVCAINLISLQITSLVGYPIASSLPSPFGYTTKKKIGDVGKKEKGGKKGEKEKEERGDQKEEYSGFARTEGVSVVLLGGREMVGEGKRKSLGRVKGVVWRDRPYNEKKKEKRGKKEGVEGKGGEKEKQKRAKNKSVHCGVVKEVLKSRNMTAAGVSYLEVHGGGLEVDEEEYKMVRDVYDSEKRKRMGIVKTKGSSSNVSRRKGRKGKGGEEEEKGKEKEEPEQAQDNSLQQQQQQQQPLIVGFHSANIGNTEVADGLLSLIKVLLTLSNSQAPPSLPPLPSPLSSLSFPPPTSPSPPSAPSPYKFSKNCDFDGLEKVVVAKGEREEVKGGGERWVGGVHGVGLGESRAGHMLVEINQEEKYHLQSLLLPTSPSLPLSTILSSLQSPSEITPTTPSFSPPSLTLPPSSLSLSLSLSDVAVFLKEFLKERKGEEGEELWGCTDEELMGKNMSDFGLTSLDFMELQSQIQKKFDIYIPSGALFTRLDTTTAATFFEVFLVSRSPSPPLPLTSSLSDPTVRRGVRAGSSSLSPTISSTPSRKVKTPPRPMHSSPLSRSSTFNEEESVSKSSNKSLKVFSKDWKLTEKKVEKLSFDKLTMEGLMLLKERVEEEMKEREKASPLR